MKFRRSWSTLLIYALLASACSDAPDTPNPQEPDTDRSDTDLSDTGPDADEPDTDDTPDVDDEPDTDPPQTCQHDSCTEEGRTRCEVVDETISCLCDEGRVEIDGECVESLCEVQGLSNPNVLSDTPGTYTDASYAIAALGSTYAVVWADDRDAHGQEVDLYMGRFDHRGHKLGGDVALTDTPFHDVITPDALAADEASFGLLRLEETADPDLRRLIFERFDDQGAPIGQAHTLSDGTFIESPALIATDQGWLASWSEGSLSDASSWRHRLASLNPDGELSTEVHTLNTHAPDSSPHMVWADDHAAVVWREAIDSTGSARDTYFQRFDAAASPLDPSPRTIGASPSLEPRLLWTGDHYVIVSIASGRSLTLNTLDDEAEDVLVDTELTVTDTNIYHISAAWTGSSIALSWRDSDALVLQGFALDGTSRHDPIMLEEGVMTSLPTLANLGGISALSWGHFDDVGDRTNVETYLAIYCAY